MVGREQKTTQIFYQIYPNWQLFRIIFKKQTLSRDILNRVVVVLSQDKFIFVTESLLWSTSELIASPFLTYTNTKQTASYLQAHYWIYYLKRNHREETSGNRHFDYSYFQMHLIAIFLSITPHSCSWDSLPCYSYFSSFILSKKFYTSKLRFFLITSAVENLILFASFE